MMVVRRECILKEEIRTKKEAEFMKRYKKLFALFAAFSLIFSAFLVTPVHAENDADVLISQLIGFYTDYMEDSVTDIERVLVELKSVDKKKGEAWDAIMHYWLEVNSPDFTHVSEVPQGLPKDNSMSVVILGFALNDDGTMKEELVGRLKMLFASNFIFFKHLRIPLFKRKCQAFTHYTHSVNSIDNYLSRTFKNIAFYIFNHNASPI